MIVTTVLVGATHDIHIQGSDLVVAAQLLQIEILQISCAFKKSWIFGENKESVLRVGTILTWVPKMYNSEFKRVKDLVAGKLWTSF